MSQQLVFDLLASYPVRLANFVAGSNTEALAQIHIRNYSIFRFGLTLFAYLEYHGTDWEADQRLMASLPRLAEWAALTAGMQQPLEERAIGEWWANMQEVFHLD